jgi:hypothetical protein
MNEHQPTLQEIGDTAKKNYDDYTKNAKKVESSKAERSHNSRFFNDQSWYAADQTRLARVGHNAEDASAAAVVSGAEHFRENEAAYHDLAVIEAHMAGVAIAVEKPLVVGKSVDETEKESHE